MKSSNEYAFSLFRLAKQQKRIPQYAQCLDLVRRVIEQNPSYLSLLHSPALPLEVRLKMIDEAWESLEIREILCFLKLLCEKAQIHNLPECIEEFFLMKKEWENCVPVEVCSAFPLTETQKAKLAEKIKLQTGKNPEMTYYEDLSLIGGIRVKIEDAVWDGSLSAKLGTLKGVIKE